MPDWQPAPADLAAEILGTRPKAPRRLIAIAGPPAAGKSTLAEALASALRWQGARAEVVPMDGFHLDNSVLVKRGLMDRKGAPVTFDGLGFVKLVKALRAGGDMRYPLFDRAGDRSLADAGHVTAETDCVVIEGNYLLLDRAPWSELLDLWDHSYLLTAPLAVLRARLVQRWLDHGLDAAKALARAQGNDIPNAEVVLSQSRAAQTITSVP